MENFKEILFQPFRDFWDGFIAFVPNFLAMLIIVVAGLLFAWLFKVLIVRFFKAINFDAWSDKVGLTAIIRKGDIWTKPAEVLGNIIYMFVIITAVMIGLKALRIPTIDSLISHLLVYLPRTFSAFIILIVGYIVAGFLSRAVLITAVNSGYHSAKILAQTVRLLLIVLFLAMSFEQLQLAPGIVVAAFSIIFGGIVIALAIAFGVGGIDTARKVIEKSSEEKKEKEKEEQGRDIEHL